VRVRHAAARPQNQAGLAWRGPCGTGPAHAGAHRARTARDPPVRACEVHAPWCGSRWLPGGQSMTGSSPRRSPTTVYWRGKARSTNSHRVKVATTTRKLWELGEPGSSSRALRSSGTYEKGRRGGEPQWHRLEAGRREKTRCGAYRRTGDLAWKRCNGGGLLL
jgi:hypothetical protein